ncbi:CubicO group peptidase (beta-lactamase class C family) [Sphingomonas sp. UYAg733]
MLKIVRIRRSAKILFLATLCAGTSSAAVAGDQLAVPAFSPAKMAASIEAKMKPSVVAFSYTIAQGGNVALEKGFGPARIAFDSYRAHGPLQRNNIASVTKTFTALAIMQLVEANKSKGVSLGTPIGTYLPDGWKPGPNVANLTFAELMRHTSGLSSGNINGVSKLGYEGVKATVAGGTTSHPPGFAERVRAYDNVNYALLRELMPKLWAATGTLKYEKIDGSQIWPTQGDYHSFLYTKYVNMHILAPINIKNVNCFDNGPTATLYYPLNPNAKINGVVAVDQSKFCGSGGLYLATNEMTKFFVYLFNTEKLLSAPARKVMMDQRLGLDAISTSRGVSFSRNGIVGTGSNSQGKAGTKACMIHLPDGVDAALVQNSPDNVSISPCSVLIAAFEAGWK